MGGQGETGRDAAELCDQCGKTISDDSEIYAVVPDSSVTHSSNAKLDGKRLVVACSREHLAQLVDEYKSRPFTDEELWAGKIARALDAHSDGLTREALVDETGLTPVQFERAVSWRNARAERWRSDRASGN